jgi:hypothetical protein
LRWANRELNEALALLAQCLFTLPIVHGLSDGTGTLLFEIENIPDVTLDVGQARKGLFDRSHTFRD